MLETDVLVIGAGPAGLTAALALSTYGINVTVITKHRSLSPTPRAHLTNQRTMELLRDLRVDKDVARYATDYDQLPNAVYCTSLTGLEFARLRPLGTGAERKSDYESASPCRHADVAQNFLEPILLRHSQDRGTIVRFDTEYLGCAQDANSVRTRLRDRNSGEEISIKSKYLIGADGGNSQVVKDLGLNFQGQGEMGHSVNIFFESDLSQWVEYRPAYLYLMFAKPKTSQDLGLCVLRPTKRWTEWLLTPVYSKSSGKVHLTEHDAITVVRDRLGLPEVPVLIKAIDPWDIQSMHAERYSKGRVLCAGDAVRRHSPANGLGSNTAMQDSYNLAWKLALVLQGKAHCDLLHSYDQERVPAGQIVVNRATNSVALYAPVAQALYPPTDQEARQPTLAGQTPDRERDLHTAVAQNRYITNSHGIEMNQSYSSSAVIDDGSAPVKTTRDAELYYLPSTRPGAHLPHAWVQRKGRNVSTLDIVGSGHFSLLTGSEGLCWTAAARAASLDFQIPVDCHVIGLGAEISDAYGEWGRVREIESSGCLLIRPDGYICFRQQRAPQDPTASLNFAFRKLLGLLAIPIRNSSAADAA